MRHTTLLTTSFSPTAENHFFFNIQVKTVLLHFLSDALNHKWLLLFVPKQTIYWIWQNLPCFSRAKSIQSLLQRIDHDVDLVWHFLHLQLYEEKKLSVKKVKCNIQTKLYDPVLTIAHICIWCAKWMQYTPHLWLVHHWNAQDLSI